MQRKPQQQTLSIRISDTLRQYLEHVKLVTNNGGHGESASMSDIAKMLLESARNDHLDHRLEVAEIQQSATEALCNIRRKWEQSHGLSQAEWVLIARYVQVGCEELSADPELPSSESFAAGSRGVPRCAGVAMRQGHRTGSVLPGQFGGGDANERTSA